MSVAPKLEPVFLNGEKIFLRPLLPSDGSDEYLSWINDPMVLRYSGRKAFPSTRADLARFLDNLSGSGDVVLAICDADSRRHLGNVALNTIVWPFGSAELSIMVGARDVWGKGYGQQAIELVAAHAFGSMGLRRLWAESPNPAFNAVMEKLGWVKEGVKRQAFLLEGRYVDFVCWGLLRDEFRAENSSA
ncbi:MAG TPA: GNAT family protein [Pseudolabrys sp.]|jgi:RimJ/RimL family protein N-acetyltransferase